MCQGLLYDRLQCNRRKTCSLNLSKWFQRHTILLLVHREYSSRIFRDFMNEFSQVNPPTDFHLGSVSSSTATAASSMSTAAATDSTDPSKRDFSNPMYEAMGDMESQVCNVFTPRRPPAIISYGNWKGQTTFTPMLYIRDGLKSQAHRPWTEFKSWASPSIKTEFGSLIQGV